VSRGLGCRIHESVEDTKLSTNKQHTLSRNEDRVGRRQIVEQAAHSQHQWHPLEDGRWGRVVGRVGAGR